MEVLPTIDSTNTELMRRARNGERATLLVAEQQTAGMGGWGGMAKRCGSEQRRAAKLRRPLGERRRTRSGKRGRLPSLMMPGFAAGTQDWSGLSLAVG